MPTGAIVARRGAAQNEARRIGNERGALPDLAACSGHGESSRNEGGGARLVPQLAILRDTRKRAGARATLATGWGWSVSEAVRDGFVSHLSCFTSKCSKIPRQRQFTHVTFAALVWTEQKSLSSTWSILRKQEDPARRLLLRAS